MPMSSHGSLHQFATLRLKTYILARKGRELLVACRPPRGLTPPKGLGAQGSICTGTGVYMYRGGWSVTSGLPPAPPCGLGGRVCIYMHVWVYVCICM